MSTKVPRFRDRRVAPRCREPDPGDAMGYRPSAAVTPDVLLGLDEEYASILALLDRATAVQRIVSKVPQLSGVDLAWVGEPEQPDRLVLQHSVKTVSDGVDGLIVPVGAGLG